MKLVIISLVLAGCSVQTAQRAMHRAAQITEWSAQASMVCDAGSTHAAMESPKGYMESNVIMGPRPSNGTQAAYWSSTMAGIAVYNRLLPDTLRVIVNSVVIGVEITAVQGNTVAGVPVCGI